MIKTMSRLLAVVSVMFLFAACSKESNNTSIAPGQGELKATITAEGTQVNFSASGKQCVAIKQVIGAGGAARIMIEGVSSSSPLCKLTITVMDITDPGTLTDEEVSVNAVLDATNPSRDNTYYSRSTLSVKITKLTDLELEGTFTSGIENGSGTHTGTITNGSFKVLMKTFE